MCILNQSRCIYQSGAHMNNDTLRIIRTMSRIGLGASGPAFKFQIERLAKALRTEGEPREAEALESLLKSDKSEEKLRPSR